MSDEDVVDVEAHEVDEQGDPVGAAVESYRGGSTAVAVADSKPPSTLFGTDDPVVVIEKAAGVATALADILEKQQLYTVIQQRKHVRVEGWTLLGTMLGVFPVLEQCVAIERDGVKGFEATVNAQTRSGEVVGRAVAYCMRNEGRWSKADDYAVASMAQTRATSKALRIPLGFVVTMAGYEATPLEELPPETQPAQQQRPRQQRQRGDGAPAQPQEQTPFDPKTMLRPDAPTLKGGWKGITTLLDEIERIIDWGYVISQAIKAVYGVETKDLKPGSPEKQEAWYRTANMAGRISELFTEETFLSDESIKTAVAEMFDGVVVEVREREKEEQKDG